MTILCHLPPSPQEVAAPGLGVALPGGDALSALGDWPPWPRGDRSSAGRALRSSLHIAGGFSLTQPRFSSGVALQ